MELFPCLVSLMLLCTATANRRIKRLEDKLHRIETKHDLDNMSRKESIDMISDKLDTVFSMLNDTFDDSTGYTRNCDADSSIAEAIRDIKESTESDMNTMKATFAQEKARARRHALQTENAISEIKHDIKNALNGLITFRDNITAEIVRSLQKQREEQNYALTSKFNKHALEVSMHASETENAIQGIHIDINSAVDGLVTFESIITDKLGKLENMLEEHINVTHLNINTTHVRSCLDIYKHGKRASGPYDIHLAFLSSPITVYCDMDTDGGGWTVFQRRQDGSVDFYRDWDSYANGFGDVNGEFWLGNDHISAMTSECCHELRVDLEDFDGNTAYAKYGGFRLGSREDNYKLTIGAYSGNAGVTSPAWASAQRIGTTTNTAVTVHSFIVVLGGIGTVTTLT